MGLADYEALAVTTARALEKGAQRKSLAKFEWDISGGCERPCVFDLYGRPKQWRHGSDAYKLLPKNFWHTMVMAFPEKYSSQPYRDFAWCVGKNHPLWLVLTTRCRKCSWCLRQRAIEWANKAKLEIERAPRTWFGTLTLTPDEHFRVECIARQAEAINGDVFERLSEDDQFRKRCAAFGPDLTRYVKRVRKESGTRLRYLLVAEKHKSGLPHWHCLVHEVDPDKPVRKAVLKGQWPYGFSAFKLVENKGAAWYLCKYLSKEQATRVRSSLLYGKI